jgi:hypothetical protein
MHRAGREPKVCGDRLGLFRTLAGGRMHSIEQNESEWVLGEQQHVAHRVEGFEVGHLRTDWD